MIIKKNCLQNKICQRVAPSKDLTIRPPKLKKQAPKNTNSGPGNLANKFIFIDLLNSQYPYYKICIIFQLHEVRLI